MLKSFQVPYYDEGFDDIDSLGDRRQIDAKSWWLTHGAHSVRSRFDQWLHLYILMITIKDFEDEQLWYSNVCPFEL